MQLALEAILDEYSPARSIEFASCEKSRVSESEGLVDRIPTFSLRTARRRSRAIQLRPFCCVRSAVVLCHERYVQELPIWTHTGAKGAPNVLSPQTACGSVLYMNLVRSH